MPGDDSLCLETKVLKGLLFCCTTEERLGVGKAFSHLQSLRLDLVSLWPQEESIFLKASTRQPVTTPQALLLCSWLVFGVSLPQAEKKGVLLMLWHHLNEPTQNNLCHLQFFHLLPVAVFGFSVAQFFSCSKQLICNAGQVCCCDAGISRTAALQVHPRRWDENTSTR